MPELTDKQEVFCREYLVDLNATQSAIRAGYSEKTAQEQASRLLSNVMVQQRVQALMDERAKRVELGADSILKELLLIAKADLGDAFDENGRLLPVKEMPKDLRRTLSSIETFEEYQGSGRERIAVGEVRKIKAWDKLKALELLGKHLKLFADRVEHTGQLTVTDRVQEILSLPEAELKKLARQVTTLLFLKPPSEAGQNSTHDRSNDRERESKDEEDD